MKGEDDMAKSVNERRLAGRECNYARTAHIHSGGLEIDFQLEWTF